MTESRENVLIKHLQAYRKKFYLNKIVKGSLVLALIFSSILFVSILGEGLLGFSSAIRTGLFFIMLATFLGVLASQVLWPFSKILNLSKAISDMEIAQQVKKYFPEIDDKLINLLELKHVDSIDNSLVLGAIKKKTDELAPVPFAKAINIKLNLRFARYLILPAGLFFLLYLIDPGMLLDGSTRLLNYKEEFTKPLPFYIDIQNHPEELISGQNFKLETKIRGNENPSELYLYLKKDSETGYINFPMDKVKDDEFTFEFNDLKENFTYYLGNEEVSSDNLEVEVLRRPSIKRFKAVVRYPKYTGLGLDSLSDNIGDFKVLKGSIVEWIVETSGQIQRAVYVGSDTVAFELDPRGRKYQYDMSVLEDENYFISLTSDRNIQNIDTVKYHINVLQDRYPSIYINSSVENYVVDFSMEMPLDFELSDDYGFSKLSIFYRFINANDEDKISQSYSELPLSIKGRQLLQQKVLELDLLKLGMDEGDEIEYFVKVWDNDYVSGPKHSISSVFTINYLSLEEQYEEVEENQEAMKEDLDNLLDDLEKLSEGFEKIDKKLLEQKKLNYDDKKELKNLLEKQQSVNEQIEELQKNFEENKEKLENNQMISEETLKKYEQLNEFLEKMDNPLLDQMIEKLEKDMENIDPEELKKQLEDLQMNEEEMKAAIERTMELLKQLEVQQKIEETVQKLENLKKKQDVLNEKLEDKKDKKDMEELKKKQDELNKDMEKINDDLKKLDEMKKDTDSPNAEEMDQIKEDGEQSEEQMNDASDQMDQGKSKKGSESQKGAAGKMQKMIEQLQSMQFNAAMEQEEQNLENLREIIENLIRLSFDQEDLRDMIKEYKYGDPQLVKKGRIQKDLEDDMEMVKDSLNELAKKAFQIEKFITDESNKVLESMRNAQDFIRKKQTNEIATQQHMSMTSINNLANMLSEVMEQMQQSLKSMKPGMGMCKKPGGSKPSMMKLGQKQGQLNQQMQDMLNKMQGKGKGQLDSKRMGELAAEQEALRKALKDAHQKLQEEGGKNLGNMGKVMQDMKDTEDELRKKQLTRETMMRQQQILNRLLDATKAVREKNEFENKRKSKTGEAEERVSPDELSDEDFKNMIRQELLKSNQLEYSNDFIILIEKYYKLLEKERK